MKQSFNLEMRNIKELFRTVAIAYYNDEQFTTTLLNTVMNRIKENDGDVCLYSELAELLNIRLIIHTEMFKTIESANVYGKNTKQTYHICETENGYTLCNLDRRLF